MDGALAVGRIGPNAITRVAQATNAALGQDATRALFRATALKRHLDASPQRMVPERDVTALHRALRQQVGIVQAMLLAREAGSLTAIYLLAHRIPRPVQCLLRLLPPWPAARILLAAIGRHAWTFTGTGSFGSCPASRCGLRSAAARSLWPHRLVRMAGCRPATTTPPPSLPCSAPWSVATPR